MYDGNIRLVEPTFERLKRAEELLDQAVNLLFAKLPVGTACSLVNDIEVFLLERVSDE